MKFCVIPVRYLLVLFLIGTATLSAADKKRVNVDAAVNLGVQETFWGELPRFYQPALIRWNARIQPRRDAMLNGSVEVDVLISRNGRIQDVRIIQPSGDDAVDREVTRMLRAARLTEALDEPGIERYVTRYIAKFRTSDPISMDVFDGVSPPPRPFLTIKSTYQLDSASAGSRPTQNQQRPQPPGEQGRG